MLSVIFFFFNDPATTEIYTLSLHDALPISGEGAPTGLRRRAVALQHHPVSRHLVGDVLHRLRPEVIKAERELAADLIKDRKSTRLNSSHANISYAVFCLKKKKCHTNSS